MKPLGRSVNFFSLIKKIPELIWMGYNSIMIFKNPRQLWLSYIYGTKPPGNMYHLRNGMKIFLSDNDHDSITVMVIFCRKEYGNIEKGAKNIDVGANIGMFTLFAAWSGASKIVSVEPNIQSFNALLKNIEENELGAVIQPFNFGIAPIDNHDIFIPISSSPYNTSFDEVEDSSAYQKAKTISIPTLFKDSALNYADVLKMDCE